MYNRPHDLTERGLIQGTPCFWPAILYDDFSGAFNWTGTGTGTGWSAEPHETAALTGPKGLLLKTRETAAAVDDEANACKRLFLKPQDILRVQIAVANGGNNDASLIKIIPTFGDGTYEYHADVYLDMQNRRAGYLIPNNAGYSTVYPTGWKLYNSVPTWNFVDLRLNLRTKYWHSLTINQFHADISDQILYKSAYEYDPQLLMCLKLVSLTAASKEAHLDHLLITCEEP